MIQSPINDRGDSDVYAKQLIKAAKILFDLKDVLGHNVLVHDKTGISRGPTMLMIYNALFMDSTGHTISNEKLY